MTEPDNLVLDILRDIRRDLGEVRETLREHTVRFNELGSGIAALRRDQAGDAEISAHLAARVDRLRDEVERIKRRLDLVD
jgi:uncharacterized protein YceH (UPF0502 family)